jgi:hypothetical protein
MIQTFLDKGLAELFESGETSRAPSRISDSMTVPKLVGF